MRVSGEKRIWSDFSLEDGENVDILESDNKAFT